MNYHSSDTLHDFLQHKKHFVILFMLIAIGWVYSFLQVAALTPRVNLSLFGPGMNTLTFLSSEPSNAMSDLISSIPLCSNFGLAWSIESLSGPLSMWFSMVLAMMVPTLLIPGILRPMKMKAFVKFLLGYCCIWFVFCIFGVALQWRLQTYGLLDNSLVINNSSVSATIFLVIGGVQLFKPNLKSVVNWLRFSKSNKIKTTLLSNDFGAGLSRGGICVYSCLPLMFVMFVFGLMNLVAMAFLTVIMYLMANTAAVFVARSTGLALIFSAMLLLGVNHS